MILVVFSQLFVYNFLLENDVIERFYSFFQDAFSSHDEENPGCLEEVVVMSNNLLSLAMNMWPD